jgi:hypothetical protein
MERNEAGLGAYHVGIALLTHPWLIKEYGDLCIDCAGDRFDILGRSARNLSASGSPFFMNIHNTLAFGIRPIEETDNRFGSASVFLIP